MGGLDIQVERNAFGRQMESFKMDLNIDRLSLSPINSSSLPPFPGIFIRAPIITLVNSDKVSILISVIPPGKTDTVIVAVTQGNLLGTAFHPELTEDPSIHKYFLGMVLRFLSTSAPTKENLRR